MHYCHSIRKDCFRWLTISYAHPGLITWGVLGACSGYGVDATMIFQSSSGLTVVYRKHSLTPHISFCKHLLKYLQPILWHVVLPSSWTILIRHSHNLMSRCSSIITCIVADNSCMSRLFLNWIEPIQHGVWV